jgi:Protein of unknown function (DUF4231)
VEKYNYLSEQLKGKISFFDNHSNKHKKLHRKFRHAAFIFTGISSILAGLALYMPEYSSLLNISILFVSAMTGVVSSFEGIRKADELWTHERVIYYKLSDLKRELEYEQYGEGKISEQKLDEFFSKFQDILAASGEKWSANIVQPNNNKNESDSKS